MCRKPICLCFFLLLLCVTADTMAAVPLVAHWKMDDGSGTIARDSSGNNFHGNLMGTSKWVAGKIAGAVEFNGTTDYVRTAAINLNSNTVTMTAWVKRNGDQTGWAGIVFYRSGIACGMGFSGSAGATNQIQYHWNSNSAATYNFVSGLTVPNNEWAFVALVIDPSKATLYLNGSANSATNAIAHVAQALGAMDIGQDNNGGRFVRGAIDDVRIYSRDLSAAQIQDLYDGIAPVWPKAENPSPADGALYLDTWASLGWTPGQTAASHDVYFGENRDAVAAGTGGTFRGNLPLASTWYIVGIGLPGDPVPGGLVPGKTYYWRIDEVEANGTTKHTGPVWSFSLPALTAYDPVPADGVKFIDPNVNLSWSKGWGAKIHYVYFGTDYGTVNSATTGTPTGATTYDPGPTLALDTTYYWRVDEFDGAKTTRGLVWSFTTMPPIPISDPNLVGWWKLDDGPGTTAVDWSGHGNHGRFVGEPLWVDGYDGAAVELDGVNDWVEAPHAPSLTVNREVTVMAWIKAARHSGPGGAGWQGILAKGEATRSYSLYTTSAGLLHFSTAGVGTDSTETVPLNEWAHVCAMVTGGKHVYYINGAYAGEGGAGIVLPGLSDSASVRIGTTQEASREFQGLIDDVRIYNKGLTQDQIKQAMRGDPRLAWAPEPANGAAVDIRQTSALGWSKGDFASQHDVYFGTNLNAVTNATTGSAEYKGRQSATTWSLAGKITFGGGPYYWRIDQVNTDATISKGRIWSFSVADYFVIDDMEDYNNFPPDRIFETWIDGWGNQAVNGAIVGHPEPDFEAGEGFAEGTIIHGGRQSMPYYYNCNFKYSEAVMTLVNPNRDWTQQGVKALTLWFRGYPATQGSLTESPAGTFTMTAAGSDIWIVNSVEADEFHYAWKILNGPGTITAKISAITGTNLNGWAKAGLMIRESLDPNSAHAFMALTNTQGIAFQYRPTAAGTSTNHHQKSTISNRPLWLRLDRAFDGTFTASHANDVAGAPDKWTAMNTASIQMAANVYIGLALTSHQAYVQAQATFSGITLAGTVTGAQWTNQDIGIRSNQAERLFVAIQGTTGPQAVVYHTDPQAATRNTWTEWNIPLTAFTGVNLSNVDRISIGFGVKGNTSPGGSGLVYFDDIRLYKARCVPTLLKPAADLNSNCVVDMADLKLLANDWLKTGAALASDLDQSQKVDFKDYNALAETWLEENLWP